MEGIKREAEVKQGWKVGTKGDANNGFILTP
jgi:hypothetical protein